MQQIIDIIRDHAERTGREPMDVVSELFERFASPDELVSLEELTEILGNGEILH